MHEGGPLMWVILGVAILALAIFLDRAFALHRAHIHAREFLDGIYNVIQRGNVVEAVTLCEDVPGPVAKVMRAALIKADEDPDEIWKSIHDCVLYEIPRLEKNLGFYMTLVRLLPMLGLLGTVLGLMSIMQSTEALGLWRALLTTAAGLSAAIPLYAGYNFLVSRVSIVVLDMEKAASDIYSLLVKRNRDQEPSRSNPVS